jgi:hypothetical protein
MLRSWRGRGSLLNIGDGASGSEFAVVQVTAWAHRAMERMADEVAIPFTILTSSHRQAAPVSP